MGHHRADRGASFRHRDQGGGVRMFRRKVQWLRSRIAQTVT
jgi:hypothetical protein